MTTIYRGIGAPNTTNVGTGFPRGDYYLGRRQKLVLTSSEINTLCNNDIYITNVQSLGGNNALSLFFTKLAGNNHLDMQVLSNTLSRDIPATSTLTIIYTPTVDASGFCSQITMEFIGDSFNISRNFATSFTFDSYAVEPDNDYYDLTTAQKQSIVKIFQAFENNSFNNKYILSKGTLLYLARKSNYQSSSINIKVNAIDKAALKIVVQDLLSNGFSIQLITKANNGELSTVKITDGEARLVVKLCYEYDVNNYYYYGHNGDFSQEAKFIFSKDFLDNKKIVVFKTINVSVPNDHTGYLTANYGATWNTPDPTFDRWAGNATYNSSGSYVGDNLDSTTGSVNDISV